jgi:hypothetical protein
MCICLPPTPHLPATVWRDTCCISDENFSPDECTVYHQCAAEGVYQLIDRVCTSTAAGGVVLTVLLCALQTPKASH